MKLIDYLLTADENKKCVIVRNGEIIATYAGKNSIPEKLNYKEIKRVMELNTSIGVILK